MVYNAIEFNTNAHRSTWRKIDMNSEKGIPALARWISFGLAIFPLKRARHRSDDFLFVSLLRSGEQSELLNLLESPDLQSKIEGLWNNIMKEFNDFLGIKYF